MNKAELEFLNKAINRSTLIFYTKSDAIDFVECCQKFGLTILGIDGFFISETKTQPSLENSIDFSDGTLNEMVYANAIQFLQERSDELLFEIVTLE